MNMIIITAPTARRIAMYVDPKHSVSSRVRPYHIRVTADSRGVPGLTVMSTKAMDALNQMGKDDAFAAFKACCGSTKYAQVASLCAQALECVSLHLSFPAQAMAEGRPYSTVEALFCESHRQPVSNCATRRIWPFRELTVWVFRFVCSCFRQNLVPG